MKLKIGLSGEDPNDTSAISALLSKRYGTHVQFVTILKGIKGYGMDSAKYKNALRVELDKKTFDFAILIRDLDGFLSQTDKVKQRKDWFEELNSLAGGGLLFMLNVWELEALIFGHIEVFNKIYATSLKSKGNPMMITSPKEALLSATYRSKRRFSVSDAPAIFAALDIDRVSKNCQIFKAFLAALDRKLADEFEIVCN